MSRVITIVLILFSLICHSSLAMADDKRVLMVLSSYGKKQGEEKPGFEFDEFSKAYLVFTSNGLEVDIASPKGGMVEADKYDQTKPFNKRILDDALAMQKLQNTMPISAINSDNYQAIFIVGGKGAMFDFPHDSALQQTIADIYQQDGIVAAVCHGPAALVNVRLSDGSLLVANKRVNAFTNQEERVFGKKWVKHFEFLLEDKLTEQGATFNQSPMMLQHVEVDGRLITGQNPFSTTATAEKLVEALGIDVTPTQPDAEQLTIDLIARLLSGDKQATEDFRQNNATYQTVLVAMYGYYMLGDASNNKEQTIAVDLMALASEYMKNPKLHIALANGYKKIGNIDKAIVVVEGVLRDSPENQQAQQLLTELTTG